LAHVPLCREADGVEVAGDGGAEEPGWVVGLGEQGGDRDRGVVALECRRRVL